MRTAHRPGLTSRAVVSHVAVILAVAVVMGVLVAGLAIPFAGVLGAGGKALSKRVQQMPAELQTAPLAERSRVLDRNGKVIATFYDENRVNVKLDQIAPIMRKAIVAIEDARFYHHGALDVKGTLRAFITNAATSSSQGGSTITQQLAKQTLLDEATTKAQQEAATEHSYTRKLKELRYAIGLEQHHTKAWILERYLNIAYFGDGAHGIQAAARHYFNRDAKDLSLPQAALLAGLVRNPSGYDPTRHPDRALARRNTVLMRMEQLGMITKAQRDAIPPRLGLHTVVMRNGCLGTKAAFFCDYVRRYLLADPALGQTVKQRAELLDNGGLTIKSTVDLAFQKAADKATHAHVAATDNAIGALAMVEPGTGEVRAISQSRPMGRDTKKGETFLNYVVDSKYGDANGFQAGSTFKVFVLASALEQGLPTTTRFNSPPHLDIPQNQYDDCNGPYPISSPWSVSNSTDSGSFDMYTGTQLSVNTYYAQLEKETGICKPFALARSMGVELDDPTGEHGPPERVPSFTLGIANVSPLEMAGAYATFAARGKHCDTHPVTSILNADGRLFKAYPPRCQQVMQPVTADTVNSILQGVMAPGGFGAALRLNQPSAGKTGTINSNMAVWFDGYTPNLATVAMIAGANQQGHWVTLNNQTLNGSYVATAHGSTVAGPMWADAMRAIEDRLPDVDFVKPAGVDQQTAGASIVPNVVGMSPDQARSILQDAGFSVTVGKSVPSEVDKGLVVQTNPAAGSTAYDGTPITLFLSSGPPAQTPTPSETASPTTTSQPTAAPTQHGHGHGGGHP